mmetsp:Transcript_50988/g.111682  ORF Transcript_50988/g.111682 Transcript_50988/m.111682 type:complete len:392 (+) Transcript_50988:674-1849(+)
MPVPNKHHLMVNVIHCRPLATLQVQHPPIIERQLRRGRHHHRQRPLRHQRLQHRPLVPSRHRHPPGHTGSGVQPRGVVAIAIHPEVGPVVRLGGDPTVKSAGDLQGGVSAVPAVTCTGNVGPEAIQDKLLGEADNGVASVQRHSRLRGCCESKRPAASTHGLVLHLVHDLWPLHSPVEVTREVHGGGPMNLNQLRIRQLPLAPTQPSRPLPVRQLHPIPDHESGCPVHRRRPHQRHVLLEDSLAPLVLLAHVALANARNVSVKTCSVHSAVAGNQACRLRLHLLVMIQRLRFSLAKRRQLHILVIRKRIKRQIVQDVFVRVGVENGVAGVHVPSHGLGQDGVPIEGYRIVHCAGAAVLPGGNEPLAEDATNEFRAVEMETGGVRCKNIRQR